MLRELGDDMLKEAKSILFYGQETPGHKLERICHHIGQPTVFSPQQIMSNGYLYGELETRQSRNDQDDPFVRRCKWCDDVAYSTVPNFIADFKGTKFPGIPGSYRIAFTTDHVTQLPLLHASTCPIPNCDKRRSGHQYMIEMASRNMNGAIELTHRIIKNNQKKIAKANDTHPCHGIPLARPAPLEQRLAGSSLSEMVGNSLHDCDHYGPDHNQYQHLDHKSKKHTTKTGPRFVLPGGDHDDAMVRERVTSQLNAATKALQAALNPLDQVDHSFYKHVGNKDQVNFVGGMIGWDPSGSPLGENCDVSKETFWHCPGRDCQLPQDPWTIRAAVEKYNEGPFAFRGTCADNDDEKEDKENDADAEVPATDASNGDQLLEDASTQESQEY